MSKLFKDRTSEESYASLLAIWRKGSPEREVDLLAVADPKPYSGSFDHKSCDGLKPEKKPSDGKEKRVCKCLYYYNKDPHNCDRNPECDYLQRERRYRIQPGEYSIKDYEVPAYSKVTDVGKVDMILEAKDGTLYATEVKPPEDNPESILRMIAEIITYTLCDFQYKGEKTHRAIAFFAGSDQEKEFNQDKNNKDLKALLDEAKISVFCFQEIKGEKAYKICKL